MRGARGGGGSNVLALCPRSDFLWHCMALGAGGGKGASQELELSLAGVGLGLSPPEQAGSRGREEARSDLG